MTIPKPNFTIDDVPRPVRAEWEKTLAALRPWLSPEKFAEAEEVHWRMFARANRWHQPPER